MMRQLFVPIVLLALGAVPMVAIGADQPSVKGAPPSAPQAPASAEKPILPVHASSKSSRKAGQAGAQADKDRPMLQFNHKGGKPPAQ